MLDCGAVDAVALFGRSRPPGPCRSPWPERIPRRRRLGAQRQQLAGSVPSVAGWDLDFDVALDDEQLARDCFRILRPPAPASTSTSPTTNSAATSSESCSSWSSMGGHHSSGLPPPTSSWRCVPSPCSSGPPASGGCHFGILTEARRPDSQRGRVAALFTRERPPLSRICGSPPVQPEPPDLAIR